MAAPNQGQYLYHERCGLVLAMYGCSDIGAPCLASLVHIPLNVERRNLHGIYRMDDYPHLPFIVLYFYPGWIYSQQWCTHEPSLKLAANSGTYLNIVVTQ